MFVSLELVYNQRRGFPIRIAARVVHHGHDIASATKSVTSILIGIALDKKFLTSVNQRVSEVLPLAASATSVAPAATATSAPRRAQPTIEHLLTMTSGWHCGVEPGEKELAAMRKSDDWPAFALALPMWAEPGSKYAYCSCNNHVLSAIISARTGESALVFARTHLFAPLGIKDAVWPADLDTIANINHFIIRMQFAEDQVQLRIDEKTGELKDFPLVGRAESRVF